MMFEIVIMVIGFRRSLDVGPRQAAHMFDLDCEDLPCGSKGQIFGPQCFRMRRRGALKRYRGDFPVAFDAFPRWQRRQQLSQGLSFIARHLAPELDRCLNVDS